MRAAEHSHPCAPPVAPQNACSDSTVCRFLINDARSEIDRLRRQLAGLEASFFFRTVAATPPIAEARDAERPSLAVDFSIAKAARRAYAVAAIGEVPPPPPSAAPVIPQPYSLQLHTVVTNLGSLLDVLI